MNFERPDILLIVLDTHRVDRLGCYGYTRDTTPNLDAFARNSRVFTRAISPAQWTIPSHASLFSGEYPAVHQTIQASDPLSVRLTTLAEYLQRRGYQTIGFCNNPLVGVLNNGFRRGFAEFYNYGGTIPATPSGGASQTKSLLKKLQDQYLKLVDTLATPIQQAVAASPEVLRIALNPLLVPLWTRFSNFKGDTAASISDTTRFLKSASDQPRFIFMNLMGTHLPYAPPRPFIQKYAPIVLDDPDAAKFLKVYNTRALQWLLPLSQPLPEKHARVLSDMYDAEVAYQDSLLKQLLSVLDNREHLDNTLVIIVSDHGEMLGEHQVMGHGLGVYEELVHVPLMIRFPGEPGGAIITQPVSTTRLFHTILAAIGIESVPMGNGEMVSTLELSLRNSPPTAEYIFSEAYPPDSLMVIMGKYAPDLIEQFHCRSTRWAVYNQPFKLIRIENIRDELYNYQIDPAETKIITPRGDAFKKLGAELEGFLTAASRKEHPLTRGTTINPDDEETIERLRKLGYLE